MTHAAKNQQDSFRDSPSADEAEIIPVSVLARLAAGCATRDDQLRLLAAFEQMQSENAALREGLTEVPPNCTPVPNDVLDFLHGDTELDGRLIQQQDYSLPFYWWRKHLPAASPTAIKPRAARKDLGQLRAAMLQAIEPIDGDQLPPIGSQVWIHLGRSDSWAAHIVTGYYVLGDLRGNPDLNRVFPDLHRVFVRVASEDGTPNARLLRDVRRHDPTT